MGILAYILPLWFFLRAFAVIIFCNSIRELGNDIWPTNLIHLLSRVRSCPPSSSPQSPPPSHSLPVLHSIACSTPPTPDTSSAFYLWKQPQARSWLCSDSAFLPHWAQSFPESGTSWILQTPTLASLALASPLTPDLHLRQPTNSSTQMSKETKNWQGCMKLYSTPSSSLFRPMGSNL